MNRSWVASMVLTITAVVLSLASFLVVLIGAADEPYGLFSKFDAFLMVGVGAALIALWIVWAISVCIVVACRRLAWQWLFALLWVAICVFYLSFCPFGYLSNVQELMLPPSSVRSP